MIKLYNIFILKLESNFSCIPYSHAILIKSLIPLANIETGEVSQISYAGLAKILTIKPAPGRKESGTPTKQTIRNYIKSIEKECGDYFKVISDGQNLKFLFPEMPKIYKEVFQNTEVNTALNTTKTQVNIDENRDFNDEVNIEPNTEVNTPHAPVKNNKYFNIYNKQTNSSTAIIASAKKPIVPNYYPDEETINAALTMGFVHVTDSAEIQAFIEHNQTHQTQWADFNPVYLRWLERKAQYQVQQKTRTNESLRSTPDERCIHTIHTLPTALAKVMEHHGMSKQAIWETASHGHYENHVIQGTSVHGVDEAHLNLWATVCN